MPHLIFFAFLLFFLPAHAQTPQNATQWSVLPDKSHIRFTATQMGAEAEGVFKKFDAQIFFSLENLAESRVDVTIDTSSVDTDYEKRDNTLKGQDWFYIEKYPTAKFTCSKFIFIGSATPENGDYICQGELTLRGVKRSLDLPFHLNIQDKTAYMTSTITLDRLPFGLGQGDWADTSIIGQNVELDIKITAEKKD